MIREEKILRYGFGGYRLEVRYDGSENDFAQVTMYDLGELRFPMIWSTSMTKEQAVGAIELFKEVGYFDMPIAV